MQLTISQFTNAISRHIDESKPDPLAKSQIESLYVNWKQQQQLQLDCVDADCGDSSATNKTSMCGTLTLSSEYISVSIHVLCCWKKSNHQRSDGGEHDTKSCDARNNNSDGGDVVVATTKQFQEELFIKLTASATESTVQSTTSEDATKKQDRKDRKGSKKLRTEMLKRLRSDHYIRQLFVDEGATLCEALIQQNLRSGDSRSGGNNSSSDNIEELEERVNVEEGTLQGIKNAIFSKSEDNLDVLDLLLNMPYLPRSSSAASNEWPSKLADRAYLRLLEDELFDACEKEGEDDLLDDLNISDANHYQQRTAGKQLGEEGKKHRKAPSKRMRNNS